MTDQTEPIGGWKNDPKKLDRMFRFVVDKWKSTAIENYSEIPPKVRTKAQALYCQATKGDATSQNIETSSALTSLSPVHLVGNEKWEEWNKLRGTSRDVAKRRYVTYISQFDESLLGKSDYMTTATLVKRRQPVDFVRDRKTNMPICAWCNSVVGCDNPPLNMRGTKQIIDEVLTEKKYQIKGSFLDHLVVLYERYEKLHRCRFGLHVPIEKIDAKKFSTWFNTPDVQGFKAYEPVGKLEPILRQVMEYHCQLLHERQKAFNNKMEDKNEDDTQDIHDIRASLVLQIDLVGSLQGYYEQKTGGKFLFEVPCQRKSKQCHFRRIADGKNHTHQIDFQKPDIDFEAYDKAAVLAREAYGIGLSPSTAQAKTTESRCDELQSRITNFHRRQRISGIAKENRLFRERNRTNQVSSVRRHSETHMIRLLENAMKSGNTDDVVNLVSRGAPANYECKRGLTPLIACTIHSKNTNAQKLANYCISVDYCNADGLTALILACKTDNLVMVHSLLDMGSDPCSEGNTGLTAITVAVRHGRSHALDIIANHMREKHVSGTRAIETIVNHQTDKLGMTPLMVCARYHLRSMARTLLRMGASLDIPNHEGKTAIDIGRDSEWGYLEHLITRPREPNHDGFQCNIDEQEEKNERTAAGKFIYALESHDIKKAIKILPSGLVPPDYELPCGTTALICAARRGNVKDLEQLIQNGCDPSYSNRYGRTALMEVALAQSACCPEIALVILKHDAECLNMRDLQGRTALFYANNGDCKELVDLLLWCRCKGVNVALDEFLKQNTLEEGQEKNESDPNF